MSTRALMAAAMLALVAATATAEERLNVEVDFGKPAGALRPLHGVNHGPLAPGGLLDLTEQQRALGIPFTRLHDCHWPNPDVVDVHAVFPNADADPDRPESYDFRLTDEYIAAVRATGAQIVYRLGESIEHTTVKRYVHPPKEAERWARVALGIVRHYNEGWAGGFRYGIPYWEIWNEPENRPTMWSGTDEDYYHLYVTAARAIKHRFPGLKVGGPSVGASGQLVDGKLQPTHFVTGFLDRCKRDGLPLDFFSWHCYTDDPSELATRAREVRRLLDSYGFGKTESHLNEWNYLPGNSWDGGMRTASPDLRRRYYETMSGPRGAAFIAAALIALQDAPVDVCNLFHASPGPFGLFTQYGEPTRSYYALRAFHDLLAAPNRVAVQGASPGRLYAAAGLAADRRSAAVLLSAPQGGEVTLDLAGLPWKSATHMVLRRLDAEHEYAAEPLAAPRLHMTGPTVALVTLAPASEGR